MFATEEKISALSLTGCQWLLRAADERLVTSFIQKYDVPEVVARILAARGLALEEAEHFLNPSIKQAMPDPSHLLDMDRAAERVAAAIISGERIAIFGDYDVDGATSSALLMRYFRALGADPLVYIPDRMKEGYGPNTAALLELQKRGSGLVITVDCGTLSFEPLLAAHEAGLDVIVIDHHMSEARLPKAYAVVNPNRLDESSEHRHMAAVGVAFLLIAAVNRLLRGKDFFQNRPEPDLRQWLDIVALGTVCDVVPLVGINRAFVAQGLKIMAARGNLGMRTLMDIASVSEKPSTYHAGFVLGPRINAGGRVGKSDLGVRILTTEDEAEALVLARELDVHNTERKTIEAMVLEEAMAQAERAADSPVLIIVGKGWHAGVIGIVAGRIKERFHKPVAVIAVADGVGKASARSVTGVDFGAAVIAARDAGLLLAGGGHAMAAGFTVEENKIQELAAWLTERMKRQTDGLESRRTLKIDAYLSVAGATPELLQNLEKMGPFGQGNPQVRVVVQNVINLKPEILKDSHIKTLFIDRLSNARLSGIAFRCMGSDLGEALLLTRGKAIDVYGQLKLQEWNGKQSVSLHIEDITKAAL